jgi:hypothetical protein|tara:strand:- start:118 stop:1404 length:1287 start_codon:yes stop_codon:yes gene_type:complete
MYFKPSYLPSNGVANILVKLLAEELGLSLNKKYEIILASFLAIAKKVNGQAFDWWIDNNNKNRNIWSLFPHVNNQSVRETYNLLKAHQYIETSTDFPNYLAERIGFGRPNWIKAKRLTKNFLEMATFVEANLPYVLVNKPETYEEKVVRKNLNLSAPTLSNAEVKQRFGREYIQAYKPIKEMNDYWAEHPLHNPIDNEFYSSANRIFHNGSIKSGGRWYGGWTDFKSEQRCRFTIDNQPVVHVDVNAMILCLLSSLTGKPMNMIGVWWDVYHRVCCQIPSINNARQKVKQVIMELTDSGDPYKNKPSADNAFLDDVNEFIHIRDLCIDAYPALKCLDNQRVNFANDLSFHEANVLTETLLVLKKMDIVAYPVHDCVIVRLGDEFDAVETFKRVFKDYAATFQKHNFELDIALTVQFDPSNTVGIQGSF